MTVTVRDAAPADEQVIGDLLEQLGHPISPETTRHQLAFLAGTGHDRVLVAEGDSVVLGVLSLHWTPLLHCDKPLGRVTALVVDEAARGRGIGSRLVAEAERVLREAGCSAVEVTSNVRRVEAHDFYRGLGYGQPSAYFRRDLSEPSERDQQGLVHDGGNQQDEQRPRSTANAVPDRSGQSEVDLPTQPCPPWRTVTRMMPSTPGNWR